MIALFLAKYWRILAILAALAVLVAGYFAWQTHQRNIGAQQERAIWEEKLAQQKEEAAQKLDEERAKKEEAEAKLLAARSTQEEKDAKNANTIKTLSAELAGFKRLRDPYAKPGCGSGGSSPKGENPTSPGNRANDGAETSGILSAEFSDLLRNLTREADEVNIAYQSCRQDAENVRELMK